MAYSCNEIDKAEKLVHFGLAGNPASSVKEELEDLLDQIAFDRHLETRGIILGKGEIQFTSAGSEAAFESMKTSSKRTKSEIILTERAQKTSDTVSVAVRGVLKMTDGKQKNGIIKTIEIGGISLTVKVPEWLMEGALQPHWGKEVIVTGTLKGVRKDFILLESIVESTTVD